MSSLWIGNYWGEGIPWEWGWVFFLFKRPSLNFAVSVPICPLFTDYVFVFAQLKWFLSKSRILLPASSLTTQQKGVTSYPSLVTGHLQTQ